MTIRRLATRALAGLAATAVTAAAVAQEVPPQPSLSRAPAPWIGFAFMVLLLAAVVGVSLLPSKRGHQD